MWFVSKMSPILLGFPLAQLQLSKNTSRTCSLRGKKKKERKDKDSKRKFFHTFIYFNVKGTSS